MKPQDFMEALGGVSQEKLDALAKWQEAGTPITGKAPAQEKRIMQTAAEPVPTQRRRGNMKQNTRKKASVPRLFPWNIGIGAAVVACAVIAVSIGKEVIGQERQMQVGSNVGASMSEQMTASTANEVKNADAAHEPVLLTELLSFSATDEMAIKVPNSGIAEIWHSMNDAAQIMQSDVVNFEEYFSEDVFAEYDVLYLAHPLAILPENVFRFHPSGGAFLADGTLRMNLAALSLDELPEGWSSDTGRLNSVNHYWFYSFPKNALQEIKTSEIDVTTYQVGELPENAKDVRGGDSAFMEYLLTTEAYHEWENTIGATMHITWAEDAPTLPEDCEEVQSVDAAHEPVEIIEKLISSGGNDSTMMKLPPEGAVQVLRSVEDAEACCQYSDENVAGQPFDFRNKLTEDVFAEYDVLYFAFKDGKKPQYCYSVDLAGGSIAADGSTLKLDFYALMFDPAHLPSDWCSVTEPDWNTYYFYTVPKNILPDLNAIELSFEEYSLGEIPDEILANPHEKVDVTDNGKTIMALQKYLETTKEYLDWLNSVPKPKYISWEDNTQLP